jgi:UrcA family protein
MLKLIVQAALLAAVAQAPALAQEARPDVRVHHGDLDLTEPVGVRTLDRRLSYAIAAACPSSNGVREMAQRRVIALCRRAKQVEVAPLRQAALAAAQARPTSFATAR